MPITSGVGSYNIGRDVSLILTDVTGVRVDMPNIISFDYQQVVATIKVDRLDGEQMPAELPKGWSGTIELDRGSSGVDDFFALAEASWMTQGIYNVATLFSFITEADRSVTTYAFDNVALRLADGGSWKGDAAVRQRITFTANRRRRV